MLNVRSTNARPTRRVERAREPSGDQRLATAGARAWPTDALYCLALPYIFRNSIQERATRNPEDKTTGVQLEAGTVETLSARTYS